MSRLAVLSLPLLAAGCFHTTHRPSCEEVSRTEVAMDEVTDAGTADELLAMVGMDATLPGLYAMDDAPVDVDVWVGQDGPAFWVEQQRTTIKTRSFGIGSSHLMMMAICPAHLELPLVGEASTADGAVEVFADGMALMYDPADHHDPGVPWVDLTGAFGDATFPPGEEDPVEWNDKYSHIGLLFGPGGLQEGSLGWGGTQQTDESNSSMLDRVVGFAPPFESTTTSEP